jgi:hypothetical protein
MNFNGFSIVSLIGAIAVFGTALGQPDWTIVVAGTTGAFWLAWQIKGIKDAIKNLPCNKDGCPLKKNEKVNLS